MALALPTTADDAAALLLDLGPAAPGNPVTTPAGPDVDTITALTRWLPLDLARMGSAPGLGARYETARATRLESDAAATRRNLRLPPVLVAVDGHDGPRTHRVIGQWNAGPSAGGEPVSALDIRASDRQRARRYVHAGLVEPSPRGAWLLTVSALVARETADALDTWAAAAPARDAARMGRESTEYRAFAADAVARIPAAFGPWLPAVLDHAAAPISPTVAAVPRVP